MEEKNTLNKVNTDIPLSHEQKTIVSHGFNKWKLGLILIFALLLLILGIVIYWMNVDAGLKTQVETKSIPKEPPKTSTELSSPDTISDEPKNIGTYTGVPSGIYVLEEWETYKDSRYGFEITNPGDWVLCLNDYPASYINLRRKTDEVPAQHGFSIDVLENPNYQTLLELCEMGVFNENDGFLCKNNITSTKTMIGTVEWEKVENGSIGVVPSFEVILGTYHDNKFFYVVDEGYGIDEIGEILSSFTFTE